MPALENLLSATQYINWALDQHQYLLMGQCFKYLSLFLLSHWMTYLPILVSPCFDWLRCTLPLLRSGSCTVVRAVFSLSMLLKHFHSPLYLLGPLQNCLHHLPLSQASFNGILHHSKITAHGVRVWWSSCNIYITMNNLL